MPRPIRDEESNTDVVSDPDDALLTKPVARFRGRRRSGAPALSEMADDLAL
jgi:hypothetical protein